MSFNRRTWLAATTSTVAVAALTKLNAAEEAAALPIVDTHQHLWDLDKFNLPWLAKGGDLHRNFVTKDYLEATAGLNVVKAVYMEVDVADDQKHLEAEHLIELCKEKNQPTVAAVIGCRPSSPHFGDYARRYRDVAVIKGFRQVLGAGKFDSTFVKNIQLLGEIDKSYDLCLPARDLGEAVKLVDQCPHTRFILDHCGNADVKAFLPESRRPGHQPSHDVNVWKRDIQAMSQRKNVICKISGVIAGVPKEWSAEDLAPIVNHCLDCFGPERVIFGSDWPVCLKGATLKEWVTALKQIIASRPLREQRLLLSENAIRHYGLA